jgi:plastocyanin
MSGATRAVSFVTLLGIMLACDGDPVGQPGEDQAGRRASSNGLGALNAHDAHGSRHVAILDDCATDPAWAPTGGCAISGGAVIEAEFGALLVSPLAVSVVGHPAWRNEPSYLRVRAGTTVLVTNEGGRTHTFTPVADYGGGRVPPLNIGLTAAPECATSPDPHQVAPGGRLELDHLAPGNHRFQCCIHPWMRALVKVQ